MRPKIREVSEDGIVWSLEMKDDGSWSYLVETRAGVVSGWLKPMTFEEAKAYLSRQVEKIGKRNFLRAY